MLNPQSCARRVIVAGCPVDALTFAETVAQVERLIDDGRPVQHCVVNASKAVLMHNDRNLMDIVTACELVNADGQAVVWASRLLGRAVPERVAGIDLFEALLTLAETRGFGVYFLGATREILAAAVARARHEHPALRISGARDGYWRAERSPEVVAEIKRADPHILFVGVPSPQKEFWLAENLDAMGVPFSMGVGGSFDVYAGAVRRAPTWMQRAGLEWAFRFIQEPRRMWKRYLLGNLRFTKLVVHEWRSNRRGAARERAR